MGDTWEMLSYWQAPSLGTRVWSGEATPNPTGVTEGCQGDLNPGPAWRKGSVTERHCVCFSSHIPRLMLKKTSLGWPAWLHLKCSPLAPLALQADVFQILTSHPSCSSASGLGFGGV